MPEFAGERGRRDGQDRALGVGQAVAAHPGKGQPGQRAAAASAHDQHIAGAAGKVHQDPACRAALYARLHQRIGGDFAPHRDERVAELLAGEVLPLLAQRHRSALRSPPGGSQAKHRDQRPRHGRGPALPVAQCLQAAR